MKVNRLTKIDDVLYFYHSDTQYTMISSREITEIIVYNRYNVLACEITIAAGDNFVFEMPSVNMFISLIKEFAVHKGIPFINNKTLFKI